MAEPPPGSSWVWIKTSADPTVWGCRVAHLVLGKLGWMLRVPGMAPGGLGARIGWQNRSSANLGGLTSPKAGVKLSSGTRVGWSMGTLEKTLPTLPRRPGSALLVQSCVVQEMALPGGGLHAPVTPLQALLRPLRHRSSEGKRAGSAPRSRGVYGRRCRWEGGERRCLLNIASSRPRGSVTQLVTLARVLPVVLPGVGGAWRLWGHPSGRIPEGAQGRMELYVAGSYRA